MWTALAVIVVLITGMCIISKLSSRSGKKEEQLKKRNADNEQLKKMVKASHTDPVKRPMSDIVRRENDK